MTSRLSASDRNRRGGPVAPAAVGSESNRYTVGDLVFGMTRWQDFTLADEGARGMQVLPPGDLDPTAALSVFGTTGMTAYFRYLTSASLEEGDTVVVSGAAAATGSTVGQIARIEQYTRPSESPDNNEKCRWLVGSQLGFLSMPR